VIDGVVHADDLSLISLVCFRTSAVHRHSSLLIRGNVFSVPAYRTGFDERPTTDDCRGPRYTYIRATESFAGRYRIFLRAEISRESQ